MGIEKHETDRKVDERTVQNLLPTHPCVLKSFKLAYNLNIRQYFTSPDRAEIPSVDQLARVKTKEIESKATSDLNSNSLEAYRKSLRDGIDVNSSQFNFRVQSFKMEGKQLTLSYKEEYLEREEIAYDVFQLQVNKKTLEQMRKGTQISVSPNLRLIEGTYVRVKKDDEQLRGLYWIQRAKKVIALVYSEDEKVLLVYVGNWQRLTKSNMRQFPRDCDAHAFDAERRLLVLSNNADKIIALFQFTENYTGLIRCSCYSQCQLDLPGLCPPSFVVKQLSIFEGEDELLLVGSTLQGYVYDMKRNRIQGAFYSFDRNVRRVLTIPGYVLEVYISETEAVDDHSQSERQFALRVHSKSSYKLLKTIPLPDVNAQNVNCIQLLNLGPQVHLLIPLANGQIKSFVVEATFPKSRIRFDSIQQAGPSNTELTEDPEGNSLLECFYSIFYKYPIRNCYETDVLPFVLFCVHPNLSTDVEGTVRRYMVDLLQELEKETGKSTGALLKYMEVVACTSEDCSKLMWRSWKQTGVGLWTRDLISSVPIQIARAEGDRLLPLSRGMNTNFDSSCTDMADVINAISFGLHESIFRTAVVPVKVLSAKGKQSVGKSYLLNHVAGAQFDIEGGRCTHGIWMTVKVLPDVVLVILDFEGLGSFDRTRQEDVLLSVFGAAVSNLTVFKADCRFDRDTEMMFDRLQDGAKLLKSGEINKLFKGKLSIVVRDVSNSAAVATTDEFLAKVKQVCEANSASNFVCNLYDGVFRVATSQPMGSSQFLQSFEDVKKDLDNQAPVYENPIELMGLLKTVLAKIYLKDWSPIDRTRVMQKVRQLDRNICDAAMFGALAYRTAAKGNYEFEPLCKFGSTNEMVADDGHPPDTGLHLLPAEEDENVSDLRETMICKFRESEMAAGLEEGSEEWSTKLSNFFSGIACRRIQRVQVWIHLNTIGYTDDEEVQQLLRKADSDFFLQLRQNWSVCGEKCKNCNRLCVEREFHKRITNDEQHSCGTDHLCYSNCLFCKDEARCGLMALHSGGHHCRMKSHTCGAACHLNAHPGCNGLCSLPSDHLQEGPGSQHLCDARTHYCGMKCDLNACKNNCYYPNDLCHTRHQCSSSNGCPFPCIMDGCSASCCNTDHFHSLDYPSENHFCDQPHPCIHLCEQKGLCGIDVHLVSSRPLRTLTFQGRRGVYEYQLSSQQIKVTKRCGKLNPRGKFKHEGPHVHAGSRGESFPRHYCDQQCNSCLRYCEKQYGHSGRHSTIHGNMSRQIFVAKEISFYVGNREYERGESAIAELCDQFCKRLGRGHTHMVVCRQPSTCASTPHRKHNQDVHVETVHKDLILDEVTHDLYWKEMDFEDLCTMPEQEIFRKCNRVCERAAVEGTFAPEDSRSPYFCQLPLWHEPLPLGTEVESGHISVHGHHFSCTHEVKYQYHTILVIDQSGSMSSSDSKPGHELLIREKHLNNRLGAVLEACHKFVESRYNCSDGDRYSLITFSKDADRRVQGDKVSNGLVLSLVKMGLKPHGDTHFANALALAKETINEVAEVYPSLSPLVIMLSDGKANDHESALKAATSLVSECSKAKDQPIIHTIKFGCASGTKLLGELAKIGKGEMHLAQNGFELADRFREFNELMTQGVVGTIRNIPPPSTGLLDKESKSWFPEDISTSTYNLARLEAGNDLYQICGRRCFSGRADQLDRVLPLNLNDTGTIGDSLSVVFSLRHMGQMYRLKCLFHQQVEEEAMIPAQSNELYCLKQLGVHRNIETIRHSFEDRADITFPWLVDQCKSQVHNRAVFIMVDTYDHTLRELASPTIGDHPLVEDKVDLNGWIMITLQLCSALSHLALKGIVHGSVFEDNIYMRTPTVPVLCNFERSFSTSDIATIAKAISMKRRELGVTPIAAPELAVEPSVLALDSSTTLSGCTLHQVRKIDIFGLGVTLYNLLSLSTRDLKFPTTRPYVESKLPNLCERVCGRFAHILFSMVRRDPELRISADDSLLACQVLLSKLNVDQDVVTNRTFQSWIGKMKGEYIFNILDETKSVLVMGFLDKAKYEDVRRVAALLKVSYVATKRRENFTMHVYTLYRRRKQQTKQLSATSVAVSLASFNASRMFIECLRIQCTGRM